MTPLRFLILLLLGAYALTDLLVTRGPLDRAVSAWVARRVAERNAVAWVAGDPISPIEIARALRHRLFRRGLDWDALSQAEQTAHRRAALDDVITARLLDTARRRKRVESSARSVREEFDDFLAEFHPRSEFHRRLGLQRSSEAELLAAIQEAQASLAWLEEQAPLVDSIAELPIVEVPEAWRVSHLFLSAHEKGKPDRSAEIRALHSQLVTKPAAFAELAAQHSEDERSKHRGGELGWVTARRTPADFMAAVKAQALGHISQPVRTHLGWHILLVTDHRPARPATADETAAEWRATQEAIRRGPALDALLGEVRSQHLNSISINEARLADVLPLGYPVDPPPLPPSS